MAPKQTRFRKRLLCTTCHRRKSKCDRQLPCAACIKSGIEESCCYGRDDNKVAKINGGQTKITSEELKDLIKKVDVIKSTLADNQSSESNSHQQVADKSSNESELFNIRRALNTTKLGEYKVFYWRGSMRLLTMPYADPASSLIYSNIFKVRTELHLFDTAIYHEGLKKTGDTMNAVEQRAASYFDTLYIPKLSKRPTSSDIMKVQSAVSAYGENLGLIYAEDQTWRQDPIMQQIERFLPSFTLIRYIVNIFFQKGFLGSALLLEDNIKTEINKLFAYDETTGSLQRLSITSKGNLATTAALLYIIRITYLSLKNPFVDSNHVNVNDDYYTCFSNYSVPIDVIELADQLLNKLNLATDIRIIVFQALSLQFIYKISAPEEEGLTETVDSGVCFSRVVSVAKSLQLNQDSIYSRPWDGSNKYCSDHSNYCRRVWVYLSSMATYVCTFFSNTLEIYSTDSILLLPQIGTNNSDHDNDLLQAVIEIAPVVELSQIICENTFQMRSSIETSELILKIDMLKEVVKKVLGNIEDYFLPVTELEAPQKLFKFIILIQAKCIILTYYYALYVFYETKGKVELSSYYARKLTQITCIELAGFQDGLLSKCEQFFGRGSWLHLSSIFTIVNRVQTTSYRIRIRYSTTIFYMIRYSLNEEKIKVLKSVLQKLFFMEERSLKFMESLGRFHNGTWWWYKSCIYGRRVVEIIKWSEEFPSDVYLKYSLEELDKWERCLVLGKDMLERYREKYGYVCQKNESIHDESTLLFQLHQRDSMWQAISFFKKYFHDTDFELSLKGNVDTSATPSVIQQSGFEFDFGQMFSDMSNIGVI